MKRCKFRGKLGAGRQRGPCRLVALGVFGVVKRLLHERELGLDRAPLVVSAIRHAVPQGGWSLTSLRLAPQKESFKHAKYSFR